MSSKLLRVTGEVLVTLGLLVLLYLAYASWFTNLTASAKSNELAQQIEQNFAAQETGSLTFSEPIRVANIDSQAIEPIGLVYIPRLSSKVWGLPLVSGVDHHALSLGLGHYRSTEMPGEIGNFAIAGHRATNGEPFAYFEKLRNGDSVFVRTATNWFEYQLVADQIVQEQETWVLGDNPKGLDIDPNSRLITLTTCDPRWNSYQRWAWWGVLVDSMPADQVPAQIESGP